MTIFEVVLALFLPGIAVGVKRGFFSREAGVAWLLTLFGHIPGVVYALGNVTKD
jgi:uncharacterized membrane protein YqaE (UPF0057 family)